MKLLKFFVILLGIFILIYPSSQAQTFNKRISTIAQKQWVDSVYNALSFEERIGQLFMVAAYSGGSKQNQAAIEQLISKHQIGGLIFMQGGPVRQALLCNRYQKLAQVPLLIAMDAEWGLGMRLDSVTNYPRQMMLGATRDSALMYEVASAIAAQCKRMNVHVNFAPDIDVNNNPLNPVINSRSFGENKYLVSMMGKAYMHGLQDNGVMACIKHFPGHGNTATDSHKDLPILKQSLSQLQDIELYPFKELIKEGAQSLMVAHLEVPALEKEPHIPTTLSYNVVQQLLKTEMGFKGLVFTDALNMDGVAKYFPPGEVDLKALMAGNDILLFSQDVPKAIVKIKEALHVGKIKANDFEAKIKKILTAKYQYGLHLETPIDTRNLTQDLNKTTALLRKKVAQKAASLLGTQQDQILEKLKNPKSKIQYIGLNTLESKMPDYLEKYHPAIQKKWINNKSTKAQVDATLNSLKAFDVNIITLHKTQIYPNKNYGIDAQSMAFLKKAQLQTNSIIVLMGNAYILQYADQAQAALLLYEDDSICQQVAADILFHTQEASGALPVSPSTKLKAPDFQSNTNLIPQNPNLLDRSNRGPYKGIINNAPILKLRNLMQNALTQGAFPGARILALQNGKVIFNEAFGYTDYQKKNAVSLQTMYDVASLTKILSTTLAVMKLYDEGRLDLKKNLGYYLPWTSGYPAAQLSIENILLHQAGLKAWIPFYKATLDSAGMPRNDLYSSKAQEGWNTPVAQNLFLKNSYKDSIWNVILNSPLENIGRYVYSDLDFLFLQKVVETITNRPLDSYVQETFYKPMGLTQIGYNAWKRFPLADIAPTEIDNDFRKQTIHKYVHDPAAAMLGGVAGHAGIFASAHDVGEILLMLSRMGYYKGKRYFQVSTVEKFTNYHSRISRRALGFDKAQPDINNAGPCAHHCSAFCFGHQGFTGTCAWADPLYQIVFVFLSNRINPSAENKLINRLDIRTKTQEYIYEALGVPVNKNRAQVYKDQIAQLKP